MNMNITLAQAVKLNATVLTMTANPYREGSKAHAQFATYGDAQPLAQVLATVAKLSTPAASAERLRWDIGHGTVVLELPAKAKRARKAAH